MTPSRLRFGRLLVLALVSAWVLALPSVTLAVTKPTPPTLPYAQITSTTDGITGTATIKWHAPSYNGGAPIGAYNIKVTPAFSHSTASTNGSTYSYNMAGFTLGTNYSVSITATNTGDYTSSPVIVNFKALARPNAPTNLTAAVAGVSGGHVNMKIAWKAPAHDGGTPVTNYALKVMPVGKTCNVTASQLACTLLGFEPGSHQQAIVEAKNLVGWGPEGAVDFTVPSVPGAPSGLAATVISWQGTTATVELTWIAPSSDGGSAITGYTAAVNPGPTQTTAAGVLKSQFSGLVPGSYILSVVAKNAIGSSSKAEIPFAVPAAPTPTPTATPTPTPVPTATPALSASAVASATPSGATPPGSTGGSGIDPIVVIIGILVAVVVGLAGALAFVWRKSKVNPGGRAGGGGAGGAA